MAQQDQPKGQAQDQKYVVKADFTDEKGKQWSVGTAFTGEPEACKRLLAAGKIEAKRDAPEAEPKQPA